MSSFIGTTGSSALTVHAIGGDAHSSDTIANLNSKISDAVLEVEKGQVTTVAKSGGDYLSIKSGLAYAGTQATTNNRWVVVVYPGDYNEDNPITVPDYVTVVCVGLHESTRMFCNNANQHGIVLGKDIDIHGLQVDDASGVGSAGFHLPLGKVDMELHDCKIKNCNIGILCNSIDQGNLIRELSITGGTCHFPVKATGHVVIEGLNITADVTGTTAVLADGAGSEAHIMGSHINGTLFTNGAHVNGGTIEILGSHIRDFINAIRIGANSTVHIDGSHLEDSVLFDIVLEAATSELLSSGTELHTDLISGLDVGVVKGAFYSDTAGDEGFSVLGEFHVGSKENGAESCLGGGDSYFWGVNTFTNTNLEVGAWVDWTAEAQSPSGSSFTAFPGVTANNCLYVGSDYTFPGLKAGIVAALVPGAGEVVIEYWNGAAWVEVNHMSTDGNSPYDQYAKDIFERINSEQIRFDSTMTGWALKLLNGETKYWIRIRIDVGITTAPDIEQIKCHTNRHEVNSDGLVESFGDGRGIKSYSFNIANLISIAGIAPISEDILYSSSISLDTLNNEFSSNSLDATGGSIQILVGTDTSCPLIFTADLYPKGVGGNFEMNLITAPIVKGTILDGSATELDHKVVQAAVAVDIPQTFTWEVDISELVPGDTVAFGVFRDSRVGNNPPDTLAANVVLESIKVAGTKWK